MTTPELTVEQLRREVLARFVTCPHYDHDGNKCPMVDRLIEQQKNNVAQRAKEQQ